MSTVVRALLARYPRTVDFSRATTVTAAYVGLANSYSKENFFTPVIERHGLYAKESHTQAEETRALDRVNMDIDDHRACTMLVVWVFEVISNEAKRSGMPGPIHASMNNEVQKVGDSIKRLFSYQYQVLPFIYTHLVSLSSTLFLAFSAFLKGLYFTPTAGYLFGLSLPLCSVLMQVIAIFGLLEVGDTILDPFGKDPEDFAVLHFTECTIISSLEAIETEAVGRSDAERPTFYTIDELQAANRLVRNMVLRFRARKRREKAAASRDNARQPPTAERSSTSHGRDRPSSPNRRRTPPPHAGGWARRQHRLSRAPPPLTSWSARGTSPTPS